MSIGCNYFEESGLPSNPIVLACDFYSSGGNNIGLHSSVESASKPPYTRTQTLLARCWSIALSYSPSPLI